MNLNQQRVYFTKTSLSNLNKSHLIKKGHQVLYMEPLIFFYDFLKFMKISFRLLKWEIIVKTHFRIKKIVYFMLYFLYIVKYYDFKMCSNRCKFFLILNSRLCVYKFH